MVTSQLFLSVIKLLQKLLFLATIAMVVGLMCNMMAGCPRLTIEGLVTLLDSIQDEF